MSSSHYRNLRLFIEQYSRFTVSTAHLKTESSQWCWNFWWSSCLRTQNSWTVISVLSFISMYQSIKSLAVFNILFFHVLNMFWIFFSVILYVLWVDHMFEKVACIGVSTKVFNKYIRNHLLVNISNSWNVSSSLWVIAVAEELSFLFLSFLFSDDFSDNFFHNVKLLLLQLWLELSDCCISWDVDCIDWNVNWLDSVQCLFNWVNCAENFISACCDAWEDLFHDRFWLLEVNCNCCKLSSLKKTLNSWLSFNHLWLLLTN